MSTFLQQTNVDNYLANILGDRKENFVMNVTALANSSKELKACDPNSLLAVAISATALNLDINPNLGYAWAVPYKNKATFQIGVNGYKQLAMRTNKYEKINVTPIYENQFIFWNPLFEELEVDFSKPSEGKIHGYAAYFKRKDGFSKTIYWTREQAERHGKRYSPSYSSKYSPWQTNFDKMAEKTVMKDLLKNWAELSTDQSLSQAIAEDQAAITIDFDTGEKTIEYVDNPETKDVTPVITKEEAGQLVALAKDKQDEAMKIFEEWGYSDVKDITVEDFEGIYSELEALSKEVKEEPVDYEGQQDFGLPFEI